MPLASSVAAPIRLLVAVPCQLLDDALQPVNGARPASVLATQSPGSLGSASRPSPSLATVALVTKS